MFILPTGLTAQGNSTETIEPEVDEVSVASLSVTDAVAVPVPNTRKRPLRRTGSSVGKKAKKSRASPATVKRWFAPWSDGYYYPAVVTDTKG